MTKKNKQNSRKSLKGLRKGSIEWAFELGLWEIYLHTFNFEDNIYYYANCFLRILDYKVALKGKIFKVDNYLTAEGQIGEKFYIWLKGVINLNISDKDKVAVKGKLSVCNTNTFKIYCYDIHGFPRYSLKLNKYFLLFDKDKDRKRDEWLIKHSSKNIEWINKILKNLDYGKK